MEERDRATLDQIRDDVRRIAQSVGRGGAIERAAEIHAEARLLAAQRSGEANERAGRAIAASLDRLTQAIRDVGLRGPNGRPGAQGG